MLTLAYSSVHWNNTMETKGWGTRRKRQQEQDHTVSASIENQNKRAINMMTLYVLLTNNIICTCNTILNTVGLK